MLKANFNLVQTQVQDVRAGLEVGFHRELLGLGEEPAGVLGEELTHRSRAVALQELPTGRHIHKLHLYPEEWVGVVDLQYLVTTDASCWICPYTTHGTVKLPRRLLAGDLKALVLTC